MRGTDVADWQAFLAAQGLLSDPTDGIFGPNTAKASRAWQASHGMPADGVIGPFSLARALEAGLTSTDEPLMPGMDVSADCTRGARVRHESGLLPFRLRIVLWFISGERSFGSCLRISSETGRSNHYYSQTTLISRSTVLSSGSPVYTSAFARFAGATAK
jgi:peptidoglycan hydrolase-like protein with peptidoglycan-binding domain